jgi:hypothetical protein
LAVAWIKRPVPVQRSDSELKVLARETRGHALYFHQFCPVSIRTCRVLQHLNVPIELRDIHRSQVHRDDLVSGLGHMCTPSLKIIEQGQVKWVCGDVPVLHYLHERFAVSATIQAA